MAGRTQTDGFLTQEELDVLLPDSHQVSYPAGSIIVREGDRTDFVLYLRSGHIKAVTGAPKAIAHICAPGMIVGELACMTEQPRTADLVALNDIEADLIPGGVWLDFLMKNQRVNLAMLRYLASRVVSMDQPQVESMTSSEHKIAKALMRLIEAGIGERSSAGIRITGVTQRDLGSVAGLSRESAAIVLRRLRETNVVSTGRGNLTIHDLDAVKRIAQHDRPPPLRR